MAASALRASARAKVNLYLHVTGRRGDGYHELDSLFVRTALGDGLSFDAAAADGLAVTGPFAAALAGEAPGGNLVLRAVAAARAAWGGPPGLHVTLEKNVPVAAGLGGGSADAAAALRAMAQLAGAAPREAEMVALAATLGADVPPCLHDAPLAVSGIGEVLRPAPALPPFALVLVNPGLALPTVEVFRAFDGRFSPAAPLTAAPGDLDALVAALAARGNDLERAALAVAPVIGEVLDLLGRLPEVRLVRMSGSGATCFGLVADPAAAERAAGAVRRARPDWWTCATAAIPSTPDPV